MAGRGRQGSGNWNKSTYAPHPRREEFHSSLPGPSRPAELSPTWKNTQAKHRNYMKPTMNMLFDKSELSDGWNRTTQVDRKLKEQQTAALTAKARQTRAQVAMTR